MGGYITNRLTGSIFEPIKIQKNKKSGRLRYFDGNTWLIDSDCEELSTPVPCKLWRDRWIEGYRLIAIKEEGYLSHLTMSLSSKCKLTCSNGDILFAAIEDLRVSDSLNPLKHN